MALIGYARVSTEDQSLDMQLDALEQRGCTKVFTEKASGKPTDPKKLERAYILYDSNTISVSNLCKMVGISKSTFYRYNSERKAAEKKKEQQ